MLFFFYRYAFYDGPPFATGLPHYGHILAGTVKDVVTRWAYQSGFHVDRRFGWDCHGLPVVSLLCFNIAGLLFYFSLNSGESCYSYLIATAMKTVSFCNNIHFIAFCCSNHQIYHYLTCLYLIS